VRSHELLAGQGWILTALPAGVIAAMTAVLTPLALRVAAAPRLLCGAAWPAGALGAVGLLVAPRAGTAALLLTVPYALVTVIAGMVGLARLLARPGLVSRSVVAVGLLFLPAAAVWLTAARAGHALLGYPPFWVLLTAAHFHVAGAYLLILAGRIAAVRGRLAEVTAVSCAIAVPLTAAGIYGPRWLELGAALLTAISAFATGLWLVTTPSGAPRRRWAQGSGAVLLGTMLLAAAFALRDHGSAVSLLGLDALSSMMIGHGVPNAMLFAFAGLLAWRVQPTPTSLYDAPPFSRLGGGWRIGAGYLERHRLAREVSPQPCGLVDALADLGHAGLDAAEVPEAIRRFYERTAEHEMVVTPRWRRGFRTGARLWGWLARRLGQLQLPVRAGEGDGDGIASKIVAVDPGADGRQAPRSWIRTFPDSRALYVAVYSTHRRAGRAYMNIAFPLPGGNLTSVLRMDHLGDGVSVSTQRGGDCGIWFVLRLLGRSLPIRLPLSETIEVWAAADPQAPAAPRALLPGASTVAVHRLWLFGVHFLTLRYAMKPRAEASAEASVD
jgi:YndJ-like protein